MSRSSPLRSSCALVLALAAFAVCAEEAAAGPRGKAKQWWIEDASVSAGAGARPPAEVFVRGTYHALTEPAPKGFGRWKLAERLQWIEEHRWTPPSVATQTLTIEVTLSKPLGEATDLAALTEVFVNGAEVPVIEKASEDRLRISLTLPTAPPPGAEVEVRLARFVRDARGRRVRLHRSGWAEPLRFHVEPPEKPVPPDPTDKGRFLPGAVTLADGRVLVVGGLGSDGVVRADAVLGTPATGTWSPASGTLGAARWAPAVARLADGRALVAGGFTDATGASATATAELFDPATKTISAVAAPLATARGGITAVATTDGIVLALGGSATWNGDAATNAIVAWEPFGGSFAPLAETLPVALTEAAVAPLRDGRVLVAGGADGAGAVRSAAVVVDPVADAAADTVTDTGALLTARRAAGAVLLPTGEVLVAGGEDGAGARLASLEAYDPVAKTFRALPGTLSEARSHCVVVVLANGAVAVVGGAIDAAGKGSRAIDVFDPLTGERVSSYTASRPLVGHAALALADGTLLLVGGGTALGVPPASSAGRSVVSQAVLGAQLAGPRILATTPTAGATRVDCDATVTVTFSRPLDAASVAGGLTLTDGEGHKIEGTFALGAAANEAVFTPSEPLPPNHPIAVVVATTVKDTLGNALADDGTRSWTFATAFDVEAGAADDGSQFGYAVAAGDVNGDGVDDLVVSGYAAEGLVGSGTQEGQVYVLFGHAAQGPGGAPLLRDLASAAGAADVTITFENHADQPGIESALQVFDFDDDGFDDIAVGVHFGDGANETAASAGEVFVVFGQAGFPAPKLTVGKTAVPGFSYLRLYGEAAGDKIGEGMAYGDVDGDGFTDLVFGATGVDLFAGAPSNQRDYGAIYVVFGDTKSNLGVVNGYGADTVGAAAATISNVRLLGVDASDRLGWSCAAGDLDGDGRADPCGGATGGDGAGNARSGAGDAMGLFGAPRSTLIPAGRYASYQGGVSIAVPGFIVYGEDSNDFMGWATAAGDLDGDGYDDLAIGGTLSDGLGNAGSNRGEVAVVFGGLRTAWVPSGNWGQIAISAAATSPRQLRVHGEDDGDAFGDCMVIADADGDSKADLLVGGYGGSGRANLTGASTGELTVFRGAGLAPSGAAVEFAMSANAASLPANVTATRFYGKSKSDRFGTTIALGDFDADGRIDLATGANRARGQGRLFQNAGEAYILWGRPSWWR